MAPTKSFLLEDTIEELYKQADQGLLNGRFLEITLAGVQVRGIVCATTVHDDEIGLFPKSMHTFDPLSSSLWERSNVLDRQALSIKKSQISYLEGTDRGLIIHRNGTPDITLR